MLVQYEVEIGKQAFHWNFYKPSYGKFRKYPILDTRYRPITIPTPGLQRSLKVKYCQKFWCNNWSLCYFFNFCCRFEGLHFQAFLEWLRHKFWISCEKWKNLSCCKFGWNEEVIENKFLNGRFCSTEIPPWWISCVLKGIFLFFWIQT